MAAPSESPVSILPWGQWLLRLGAPLSAVLFLLLFHWRGLDCWFFQDDFGWLHLGLYPSHETILQMLFSPKAHGNIRPWSENLFFFAFYRLFGMNPLPFRIAVFVTASANVLLLFTLVRALTGSVLASLGAAIFWLANPALTPIFCWTCIYNETQYLFFVLLALLLFIRGKYWMQLGVFVLGLGSLETMVMYPVAATLYAWLYDRTKLRRTLPLYLISTAYTAAHFLVAPAPTSGPYAIHLDRRIFSTLWTYVQMALGPERLAHFHWTWPAALVTVGTMAMGLGVLAAMFAAGRAGLFGAGWFIAFLLPVLPLPDHIIDYFIAGPAIGLAIILGAAMASRWRVPAMLFGAIYLAVAMPAAWDVMTWERNRSHVARDLVQGVVRYDQEHPGKTILVTGVDSEQFYAAFSDVPFDLYGMHDVFLAPGADRQIPDGGSLAPLYVLPPEKALPRLKADQAVVLDVSGGAIRDATVQFLSQYPADTAGPR
ncbi:MAG TPA: hypothetical protein VEV17_27250 [Bryobacteraceae bacterium]|nr:hypothetical protein [Bryobacteraceae bacterium]